MRSDTGSPGYTIIETMVFLAVSGFMFLIAAAFISGKQASADFKQSMNSINSQVEQVINDVSNGDFPQNNNIDCTADDTGGQPVLTSGSSEQGTNQNCVFMGKVIQFNVNGNASNYDVYTVAGRQYVTDPVTGTVPSDLAEADPVAVYDTNHSPPDFDLTSQNQLEWGLKVISVKDLNNPGSSIAGIGFFTGFGNYDNPGGTLESGSEGLVEADVTGGTGLPEPSMVGLINGDANFIQNNNTDNIQICFQDNAGQYAILDIGSASGQGFTTNVSLYNTQPTSC